MTNSSGINPVDVKVLVLPDKVEEVTAGGVYKPQQSVDKEKYATTRATLVAVGPNAFSEWGDGNRPTPGARVLVAQYAGSRAKGDDKQEYVLANDEDVIGTLEVAS